LTQLAFGYLTNALLKEINLSVIIPVFNEKDNLPEVVNKIENTLGHLNFELIIVDDNSPDGTAAIARNLNAIYGNIKTLKRPSKLGLSSAVIDGFKISDSGSQILAVMDADMQHPPELLAKMYKKIISGNDLVIASRYINGGGTNDWRLYRKVISRTATACTHLVLPKTRNAKDILSGFFMVKKKVIAEIHLDPIGYKILLEILMKGNYGKTCELPYVFETRKNGKSNLDLKEILKFAVHISRLLRNFLSNGSA
jgi:dolichol-phosphate mannosyltransferase